MFTNSKQKKILRVTVDLEPAEVKLLEEAESVMPDVSRREIFIRSLKHFVQLSRIWSSGLRFLVIDPAKKKDLEFSWDQFPEFKIRPKLRTIDTGQIKEGTIRKLMAVAEELRDLDLQRVSAMMAQSAWDPKGDGGIDEGIVADLIEIALLKRDERLTCVVRDIFTQIVTVFASFEEMLAQSKHGYRPGLDTRYREQRFLDSEYFRELPKRYPREALAMRQDGSIA